ncbi:MAG: BLUF domain-containing protein [Betaproteobacteria bacterium]|nr:BLUF domain-containing protein [Betaproteobacteria bacterium]
MLRVTYLSRETDSFSARGLIELLEHCKNNNPALGITGMLMYANGTFLQTLEGEAETVEILLAKIERDKRHHGFQVIKRESIDERIYKNWSMGFERLTEAALHDEPALKAFQLDDFNPEFLSAHPSVVENLIQRHRSLHWDPLIREIDARDQFIAELRGALLNARQRNEQALLLIESVVEASAEGNLTDIHLQLCRRMVETLRNPQQPSMSPSKTH